MTKPLTGAAGAPGPDWASRYALLHAVGELALADLPDDALLRGVTDRVIRMSGADGGFLIRVSEEERGGAAEEFEVVLARNYRQGDIRKPEFEVSRTIIRRALREGRPVFVENASILPAAAVSRSIRELKVISVIALPLRRGSGESPYAVIYLDRRRPGHQFCAADMESLGAVMKWANRALELAFESRQQRGDPPPGGAGPAGRDGLVGNSPALQTVVAFLVRAAKSTANVLLRGETGTGKELAAQYLHRHGAKPGGPYVAVNCGAIPSELLESELFGHEAGAFTGAHQRRIGRFQQAGEGTLFLDEIGDLPLPLQAKLLRVVETRAFPVVGGGELPFRARLVAATHQPLERLIREGKFRQDLYYRLAVLEVTLPALRQRRSDILPLALHFIAETARRQNRLPPELSPAAARYLQRRAWPGNIRELAHLIERAILFCDGPRLEKAALAAQAQEAALEPSPRTAEELRRARDLAVGDLERRFLEDLLRRHHGDVAAAARGAGFSRPYLYRMIGRLLPEWMENPRG